MFRKKIKPGDFVRQKSTGELFQVDYSKQDVFVCHKDRLGEQHMVSVNDVVKVKPPKTNER